jgi:hypothetical protein
LGQLEALVFKAQLELEVLARQAQLGSARPERQEISARQGYKAEREAQAQAESTQFITKTIQSHHLFHLKDNAG